ncbi:sensor histidine kinase [Rhizobacter fulvus]
MTPNPAPDEAEPPATCGRIAPRELETARRAGVQLLSMLGHELRNPLNALVTSAEVLRSAPPGSAVAESARAVIARQTRKLSDMVDRVLEIGHVMTDDVALSIEPTELRAALQAAMSAATPQADASGHALALDAPAPIRVNADPVRVVQVMSQLLGNALRHTPAGTAVVVSLRRDDGDAVISVRDTGPGIDAAVLPHVFDPFAPSRRVVDRTGGGLGVGLALARRLVELQDGSITVASSPGRTVFEWRMPALDP